MDTIGNVIDKMFTVNLKITHNTDPIRLQNLNAQKEALMAELDAKAQQLFTHEVSDLEVIRPQHKTY